jgi:hypothetical protein
MLSHSISPITSHSTDWWNHNSILPMLNTSINMMAGMELAQSPGTGTSPITQEDYMPRRTSTASSVEIAEWQEKVRVEVSAHGPSTVVVQNYLTQV